MSVKKILRRSQEIEFNGKLLKLTALSTEQALELIDLFNEQKETLGIDPKEVRFTKEYMAGLAERLWSTMKISRVNGKTTAEGPARAVFEKLAEMLGCEFNDFLLVSPDETFEALTELWLVNTNGPFGTRVHLIIGALMPRARMMVTAALDVVQVNLQAVAIRARQFGGMGIGGMTQSSDPFSSTEPDGQNVMSSPSPSPESLPSSPPLDTPADTNLQSSETPEVREVTELTLP